jgi:Tol biopolymer transport system component
MRAIVALALCAACGSEAAGIDAPVAFDSTVVDTVPVDAPEPTCAASSFTTSSPVTGLNSAANETYLRMSPDELTAYFARQEPDEILYVATRPSTTAPFSTPVKLVITGNGTLETTSASVTADGLTMYFTSNRTGTLGGRDIYRATRAATTTNFGSITQLTALSSASAENDAYVLPDHSAIYFSSNRSGTSRLYRAAIMGTTFGPSDEVLSDTTALNRVVVSADELTMLYTTGGDLRLSTRATANVSWLPGANVTALDTADTDLPSWISADKCRLYFATNTSGDYQLRVAVRTPQ